MKVVKVKHRRLPECALLLTALLLSSSICFFVAPAKGQAEVATIKIINPLSNDNHFTFNASLVPVNSTFTVDFYVVNVTGMCGWQILIEWNNTVIHFKDGGIPDDNALAPALDQGATLNYPPPPLSLYVEKESNDTDSFKYGASVSPSTVDVPTQAILCRLNFTIAATPEDSRIFTNIEMIKQLVPGPQYSMDSYVQFVIPGVGIENKQIYAEPAIVSIEKSTFKRIWDVEILSVGANPNAIKVGETSQLAIVIKNIGNDLAMFNVTVRKGQTLIARFPQVLGAYQNVTYNYAWNSSGLSLDTPISVTIFGIPIVVAYETESTFSVDLSLPEGYNTNNTHVAVNVTVGSAPAGPDYWRWLILVSLSTSLGQLLLGYTIIFVVLLAALFVYRRLRSPKPPSLPKTKAAEKPDNASK